MTPAAPTATPRVPPFPVLPGRREPAPAVRSQRCLGERWRPRRGRSRSQNGARLVPVQSQSPRAPRRRSSVDGTKTGFPPIPPPWPVPPRHSVARGRRHGNPSPGGQHRSAPSARPKAGRARRATEPPARHRSAANAPPSPPPPLQPPPLGLIPRKTPTAVPRWRRDDRPPSPPLASVRRETRSAPPPTGTPTAPECLPGERRTACGPVRRRRSCKPGRQARRQTVPPRSRTRPHSEQPRSKRSASGSPVAGFRAADAPARPSSQRTPNSPPAQPRSASTATARNSGQERPGKGSPLSTVSGAPAPGYP